MNRKILLISILTLFLDQLSKVLVSIFFNIDEKIEVIKNFFAIHFVKNYGAAWSLFSNHGTILILISIIALIIIIYYMYNFKKNKRNILAFGLLIGGIIGNLIDRIFLGYVRDFLSFQIINYSYPIFNLADVFIVVGIFLLIIAIIKGEDRYGSNKSKRKWNKNR